MKIIAGILLAAGLVFSPAPLHAQTVLVGGLNNDVAPVQSSAPDSIVQITAEMKGLQAVAYSDLPVFGTYWEVLPGGTMAPLPTPVFDPSLPIFAITSDIFLVDASGGELAINRRKTAMMSASSAATAAVHAEASVVASLIDQVQAAATTSTAQTMSLAGSLSVSLDATTNGTIGTPDALTNSISTPDYGTNLWLAQTVVGAGQLTGIGSNTIADIVYTIQTCTDLSQGNWINAGTIIGSELTNWTALSVTGGSTTNLFIRLRSEQSSDGSGLPDWWEAEYGLTTVDPNAQDSAGDGYTIYQKYQMGVNPNTWVTPAAPQGLSVSYKSTSGTATLNWLPSHGSVASYNVQKSYLAPTAFSPITNYNTTSTTSYQDSMSGNQPDIYDGDIYNVSYQIQSIYQNGKTSAWSRSLPLQQTTVSAGIVPGSSGAASLFALGIPSSAALIRLVFIDENALEYYNDTNFDYSEDIPVSSFANGQYLLPTAWTPSATDGHGVASYKIYAESVDASGNSSAPSYVPTDWVNEPFYDGRAQLKENLVFQMRAATTSAALSFYCPTNYDRDALYEYNNEYDYPSNYACAGLYPFTGPEYYAGGIDTGWGIGYGGNYGGLDIFQPFEENYLFRNFAYNLSDSDITGALTTGAGYLDISDSDFLLLAPLTYLFQTNGTSSLLDLLSPNESTFLLAGYSDSRLTGSGLMNFETDGSTYYTLSLSSTYSNWFGLRYVSGCFAYQRLDANGNSAGLWTNLVSAAKPSTYSGNIFDIECAQSTGNVYLETAQPQFNLVKYCFYQPQYDWLPGSPYFSPTNDSPLLMVWNGNSYDATNGLPLMIVPAGSLTLIAGYAKLSLLNGYQGVYGYLGQYFTNAYELDNNGKITTNVAGILTPYGYYFPTNVGAAALVTMPDLNTQQQGICIVYSVSLQVDKNHDGAMDLSLNGSDATSQSSPMVFWANNNFDRLALDKSDGTNYMDDVQIGDCPYSPNVTTPDCNYCDKYGIRVIPTTRDLEDFTRLWVCGITTNLLAALPTGSTVTLSWGDVGNPNPANPTIDIFQATDPDGGIEYLTNETAAANQANSAYSGYVGRLGPGQSIQLNASFWSGWAGNHFIWCGVSNGTGGLRLTLADGSGSTLAQTASYIQIVDIKQMYERWTVGDNPNIAPTNVACLASENLPLGVASFEYPLSQNANTPYILFVHGWNMQTWEKDRFAETAFKRLYLQGYQGRFGSFRWPTSYGFTGDFSQLLTNPQEKGNFDNSENNAWLAGTGLLNKLNALNAEYPGRVYVLAHSMGNVVTSEALRLAGNSQVVNTYVASQAAVSAQTYDATVANYSFLVNLDGINVSFGPHTPNIYENWFAGNNGGGAGLVINFYNVNDYALSRLHWQLDQLLKPDVFVASGGSLWNYEYGGSINDPAPWNYFFKTNDYTNARMNFDIVNSSADHYEVFSHAAQSYTTALGATTGVNHHLAEALDLTSIWPLPDPLQNNYGSHFWHSAEFRGDNPLQRNFWSELLGSEGFNINLPFP